jgi:hypothetical protein
MPRGRRKAVTAAQVVLAVAEALQVRHVVGQLQVVGDEGARPVEVPTEVDRLLDREHPIGSEDLARATGVLGRHQIGVRAGGAIAREVEHPRSERGEHAAIRRHGGLGGVELVEVLAHRGQRSGIALADHRPVAGAEPEHEATRVVVVKRRAAARHVLG